MNKTLYVLKYSIPIIIVLLLLPTQIIAFSTSSISINSKNEIGLKNLHEEKQSKKFYELTLITGDIVEVAVINNTKFEIIGIKPADPKKLNKGYRTWEDENGLYVIPSDVDIRKVDIELFNVKYLIKEGYYNLTQLPIMVITEEPRVIAQNDIEKTIKEQKYGIIGAKYKILPAISSKLNLKKIKEAFSSIISKKYVKKILLDKKVRINLNESVPLIGADKVWEIGYNGSGIRIAIIDTGIDNSHPDFYFANGTSKIEINIDFTDDHNPDDLVGHGTHCAGIAAGTGAASGGKFKGVAPAAKIWNVKVLNKYGWGYWSWIISGIEYATYGPDRNENSGDEADVLSLSLGSYWWSDGTDPVSMACDNAVDLGRIVVVAAGNWKGYFHIGVPATARKAITVGATDKYDNIAGFSSYGPTIDYRVKPDILAPGVNIISARAKNGWFGPIPENSYYTMLSGTSMATPHVAGAAALLKQYMLTKITGGKWSPEGVKHIKDALISHAKDLGYNVYQQGGGRLDIYKIIGISSICVHPATISFGLYTENKIDSIVLEVSARRAVSTRNLTLSVSVEDIINGGTIDCASLNVTTLQIPPGEVKHVLLTINTTVPKSIYSGKLFIKDIDGNYTIHAIFGFARLNKLEITFLDLNGNPLANALVFALKANATYNEYLAGFHYKWIWNYTDSNGKANLYTFNGIYYICGWDYGKDAYSDAYAINKSYIDHDMNIILDLRNAYKISYSPLVSNQIIAWFSNRISYGYYNETYGYYSYEFGDSWYYPKTTDVYITSTDLLFSTYYQHYDKSYINVPDPSVLLASELYSICFYQKGINQSMVLYKDPAELAKVVKDYRVALTPSISAWIERSVYVSLYPYYAWLPSLSWEITSPKKIMEWLVPEIEYWVQYEKYSDQPNVNTPYFLFVGWEWYPSPGNYSIATNSHPLSSDLSIDVWSHDSGNIACLYTGTDIFQDNHPPYFYDTLWSDNGRLIIKRNGTTIIDTGEFYDFYNWKIDNLQLPARFEVELYGRSNLYLSTNMYTKIQFDVPIDGSYYIWNPFSIIIEGLDLNNTYTAGNITGYLIANKELIQNPLIEYSIDDGITWITVEAKKISDNKYSFLLGNLMGVYVSLRINATDIDGANISQTIIRGFYAIPKEFEEWSLRGPRVDQLYIKIYPNITSEAIGLKNNEIDLMDWPVPPEFVNEFQSDPNIILAKYNEFGMFEFDLNHRKWPTSNLHFRRALAYLTNKDALIRDVLKGYGTRIDSPVVPSQGSWQNPNIIIYNYDPSKAAEELELGGFIDTDGDGIRNDPISGTNMAPIDIIAREDHIPRRIAGTWLAEELEKLGVPVNLQILPRRDCYQKVMFEYNYHIYTGGWILVINPTHLYDLYHSSMDVYPEPYGNNYIGFRNSTYDYWAEKVIKSSTYEEVLEAVWKCQEIIAEQVAIIPLYSSSGYSAVRTTIEGFVNAKGYGFNNYFTLINAHLKDMPFGGTLRWGFCNEPTTLNPIVAEDVWSWYVLDMVYEPLIRYNPIDPAIDIPCLAESWKIENWTAPGNIPGLKITFNLVSNATWHDGVPFNSSDVKFTYDYLIEQRPPRYLSSIQNIINVETPDAYTVIVYCNTTGYFLLHTINIPILPKHIWENVGSNWSTYNPEAEGTLIGTGPYKFIEWIRGDHIILQAYNQYYRRIRPAFYTLADFPKPFIFDTILTKTILTPGASDSRGPVHPAHTVDVAASNYISFLLGKLSYSGNIEVYMDWEVATFDNYNVYGIWKEGNVITFGSPGVNLISYYLHHNPSSGGGVVIPAYFGVDEQGQYIYSTKTGIKYRMQNDYGQGKPVTDYALIVLYYDQLDNRYIMMLAGLSGVTTREICKWLTTQPQLQGTAMILKFIDNEGDFQPDIIEIIEII